MTEYRFYPGVDIPPVSTFDFHKDRERAPHFEQPWHKSRFTTTIDAIHTAIQRVYCRKTISYGGVGLVDLGCGDGGLIQHLINHFPHIKPYGYDFQPSNAIGWDERGLTSRGCVHNLNFIDDWSSVLPAHIYVITEVLEHLADPHQMVQRIRERNAFIVASSPWNETPESHDACHAWGWDFTGYKHLLMSNDFDIMTHVKADQFQIILGAPND